MTNNYHPHSMRQLFDPDRYHPDSSKRLFYTDRADALQRYERLKNTMKPGGGQYDAATLQRMAGLTPTSPGGAGGLGGSHADAINKANAANEQRYQQALGIMDQRLANADSFGTTESERLNREEAAARAGAAQHAMNRGLRNSTVSDSLDRNVTNDFNFARTNLQERLDRYRNELLGDKAGVIERRTDLGPDTALAMQAAAGYGRAAGSRGGSSGGSGVGSGMFNIFNRLPATGRTGAPSSSRSNLLGTISATKSRRSPTGYNSAASSPSYKRLLDRYGAGGTMIV